MKDLQLLWVYQSEQSPGSIIKAHTHDYYHLICMQKGVMDFELDSAPFRLQAGDVVIVPQGCPHGFRNSAAEKNRYYEIKFAVLNPALAQDFSACGSYVQNDAFSYHLVEHIAAEYFQGRTQRDASAHAALHTLLFHFTSDSRPIEQNTPSVLDTCGFSSLSKQIIDFLSDHFSSSLTLDDIAASIGMSKNYLCNAFKKDTGTTILDCLNNIRIRKAAELIVYSDLSLAQVSEMCGFVSTSHFNRVFAHYTGIPPGQYRRAYAPRLIEADGPTYRSTPYMYSVLAGRNIPLQKINEFEANSTDGFSE